MLSHASAVHVTSPDEEMLTAAIAPNVPRVMVPNGIFWNRFQDIPDGLEFRRRYLADPARRPVILSLGRIRARRPPNDW